MRIISYGHVKPKTMFCSCCGAVFEYLPRDIQNFRPGTPAARNFVRCPVCGHITWVKDVLVKHDKYLTFADEGQ